MALDPTVQVALISTAGTLGLGLVTACAELLRRTFRTVGRVRDQVENDHSTNLREDVDRLHADVREVLGLARSHSESINLLHAGLNTERTERIRTDERLDHVIQTAVTATAATVSAVVGGTN